MRDGEPVLLGVSAVADNFFSVLGMRAALGRTFRDQEPWEGSSDIVMLSHEAWVTHFAE